MALLATCVSAANIVKSANDAREYDAITLANGLQVLLVSDDTTDTAAAAMDVHVGSWDNPMNIPGLAHFLGALWRQGGRCECFFRFVSRCFLFVFVNVCRDMLLINQYRTHVVFGLEKVSRFGRVR